MTSRQLRSFYNRKDRGAIRVSVTLDPALEPEAVAQWLAVKARYGGQKPALLAMLRGRENG